MSLEQWSYYAAIAGALIALIGFPVLGWQLSIARSQRRDTIRLSTSQVLLAADAVLATHADVAAKLRPGGEWAGENGKMHPTANELPLAEPYLGVFERIFVAHQAGQVDAETLDQLYGYRLSNIWGNQQIVDMKLQNDQIKKYWKRFIALTYLVEAYRGRRYPLHTDKYFPNELFANDSVKQIQKKLQL